MRGHLIAAALITGALALWLMRPGSVSAPGASPRALSPLAESPPPPPRSPPPLARDPFRYADERRELGAPPGPDSLIAREPPAPRAAPTPDPLRLNGFVWRGGALRAVLAVHGITVVAGTGESAEGYQLLSVDEDAGVRLRGPSGEELVLRPAR